MSPAMVTARRAHNSRAVSVVCLLAIVAVRVLIRWPFISTGAPMFVTPDSESYLLPGWELAHGQGFNPELRRTPVYSLFISGVLSAVGDNIELLATAQHVV